MFMVISRFCKKCFDSKEEAEGEYFIQCSSTEFVELVEVKAGKLDKVLRQSW